MDISKSTMQGIAALVALGVLSAGGFLIVKPQIVEGLDIQTKITTTQQAGEVRQLRLDEIEKTAKDGDKVLQETLASLKSIPQRRDATDIERSVISAMGDQANNLVSFQYGTMDPTQPAYKAPKLTLKPAEGSFAIGDPGDELSGDAAAPGVAASIPSEASAPSSTASAAPAPTEGADPAAGSTSTNGSAGSPNDAVENNGKSEPTMIDPNPLAADLEAVPFILKVDMPASDTFAFLDRLQKQSRLIHVVSTTTTSSSSESSEEEDTGGSTPTLTIYAYAFAGSDANVVKFTKNVAQAAGANE